MILVFIRLLRGLKCWRKCKSSPSTKTLINNVPSSSTTPNGPNDNRTTNLEIGFTNTVLNGMPPAYAKCATTDCEIVNGGALLLSELPPSAPLMPNGNGHLLPGGAVGPVEEPDFVLNLSPPVKIDRHRKKQEEKPPQKKPDPPKFGIKKNDSHSHSHSHSSHVSKPTNKGNSLLRNALSNGKSSNVNKSSSNKNNDSGGGGMFDDLWPD